MGWLCKNRMTPTGHFTRGACARSVIVVHKRAQLMSLPTHFNPHTLWLITPFRVGGKKSVYIWAKDCRDVITSDRRMKGLCNLLDGTRGILFGLSHS